MKKVKELTEEIYRSVKFRSSGGYLTNNKEIIRPFIFQFPNPWEKRSVEISVMKH